MRRYPITILLAVTFPIVLGAKQCSESEQCKTAKSTEKAICEAAPDSASCTAAKQAVLDLCKPEPDPTPEPPINCLTHPACPDGYHCENGIGCVADPLPDPPTTCVPPCPDGQRCAVLESLPVQYKCVPVVTPLPTLPSQPPGTTLRMNNKRWGGGAVQESTLLVVGSRDHCASIGLFDPDGVTGRNVCPPAKDGDPERVTLELAWLGKVVNKPHACPVWQYTPDKVLVIPCNNDHQALASCDHFGSPGAEDDDKTPAFEGEPKECGDQQNAFGPFAGFSTRPHSGGKGFARACLPDYSGCGPWIPVKL
jgi:hypothetical protein